MESPNNPTPPRRKFDEPWTGPLWKHPYFLYIGLTMGLFGFLMLLGFLALQNDWVPHR